MDFAIWSPAFSEGEEIPIRYSAEGKNLSPPLRFTPPPRATKSLALIVEDPDAPNPMAPKRLFTHWILYDINPQTHSLPEGVAFDALPIDTHVGVNDLGDKHYYGPNPPYGRHRYFFRLYALDKMLRIGGMVDRLRLRRAMHMHVIAEASCMGTYQLHNISTLVRHEHQGPP